MTPRHPGDARSRLQSVLLGTYARLAETRLLDNAVARRGFEGAYEAYKVVLEAGPVHHLRRHATSGSVVVDVGANIGFFTVRFARWVGPGGRVLAIEPEARNIQRLQARLERRELAGRVSVVKAAAAGAVGRAHLVVNHHHPGDHCLGDTGVEVDVVTVDSLVARETGPVTLIKVDVQGAEQLVLDGAAGTIAAHRPALFIEVTAGALERFGTTARGLIDGVLRQGYTAHLLGRRGVSPALGPAALEELHGDGYNDLLFLPA